MTFAALWFGTDPTSKRPHLVGRCSLERTLWHFRQRGDVPNMFFNINAESHTRALHSKTFGAISARSSIVFTVKYGQTRASTSPLVRAARPLAVHRFEQTPAFRAAGPPDTLLLAIRKRHEARNMANDREVADVLGPWAAKRGLRFDSTAPPMHSPPMIDSFVRFRRARIVFTMQGGANFNVFGSDPGTTVVMIGGSIFSSAFMQSMYMDTWILPSGGSHYTRDFYVDIDALTCLLALMDARDSSPDGTVPPQSALPECAKAPVIKAMPYCTKRQNDARDKCSEKQLPALRYPFSKVRDDRARHRQKGP